MSGSTTKDDQGSNALLTAIANPKQVNLLGAYQGAADAARGIWSAREMQAKQAVGENLLAATGPDGQIDTGKLATLNSQNPTTALAAGQSAANGQLLRSNDFGFNTAQQAAIGHTVGSVLTSPDQTPETYKAALDYSLANHGIDQAHYTNAMSALQAAGRDPTSLRQFGTRLLVGTLAGPEMAQAVIPGVHTQTAPGGITQGYTVGAPAAPDAGAVSVPPQSGAPQGLSPEAATTPTQIGVVQSGPNRGAPITGTRQQFINTVNGQPNVGPGRLPAALAPSQAAPAQPQGIVTGLGPGATTAATEAAGASAKDFQGIADAGTQAQTRGAVLDNMLSDTSQFTTGPGADVIQRVRAVANRMGLNVDTEKLSASESFNKLAAALAQQQQRGAGSDAQLGVSQSANPHADLSPAGVDLMLRQLRGNEDYLQARQKLAATFPDRTDRTAFEDQIGRKLDPRTFQYDRMTPPQKMTYFKSLGTDKAKADFIKAHDTAASLLGSP